METIAIIIAVVAGAVMNYMWLESLATEIKAEIDAIDAKIDKFLVEISNLDDEIAQLRAYQEE